MRTAVLDAVEQDAGGGGEAFTLAFIGQRTYAGRGDTLTFVTNATMTNDEERQGLTRTLALGLVQFVARPRSADPRRATVPEKSPPHARLSRVRPVSHRACQVSGRKTFCGRTPGRSSPSNPVAR